MGQGDRAVQILLVRHAQTEWNAVKRIQGHSDITLNETGRREAGERKLPSRFKGWHWLTSPLTRTRETALLMGACQVISEPAVMEMHWGDWEGETLADLRNRLPEEMRERESAGLDFRPPNGESPRDVQERLRAWLASVHPTAQNYVVVTHKGVIRAALALATGWDMRTKPPVKLDWHCGHLFETDIDGALTLSEPNIALV